MFLLATNVLCLVRQFEERTGFGGPFPANVFVANQERSENVTLLAGMTLICCNISISLEMS